MSKNTRKVSLTVNIAFGSPIEQALALMKQIADSEERILKYPQAVTVAKSFGESAIHLELIFWIKTSGDTADVSSHIIVAIDRVFKEQGIRIPYPESNVHVIPVQDEKPK